MTGLRVIIRHRPLKWRDDGGQPQLPNITQAFPECDVALEGRCGIGGSRSIKLPNAEVACLLTVRDADVPTTQVPENRARCATIEPYITGRAVR